MSSHRVPCLSFAFPGLAGHTTWLHTLGNEVSGLTSVHHQTLDKNTRIPSQQLLMRGLIPRSPSKQLFARYWLSWVMFSSHSSDWLPLLPHSLTGFSWEHYFNKSFAPKPLSSQVLVVESCLRHKQIQSNLLASYPWRPRAVPSHPHISAKAGILHCDQDTHHFMCCAPFPRSVLLLFWPSPTPSPATLTSLPGALWKQHSTVDCSSPITCSDSCHLPAPTETWFLPRHHFPVSLFLRKGGSFSHLLSHWNLETELPMSFDITSGSWGLLERTVRIWISEAPSLYTGGNQGNVSCI